MLTDLVQGPVHRIVAETLCVALFTLLMVRVLLPEQNPVFLGLISGATFLGLRYLAQLPILFAVAGTGLFAIHPMTGVSYAPAKDLILMGSVPCLFMTCYASLTMATRWISLSTACLFGLGLGVIIVDDATRFWLVLGIVAISFRLHSVPPKVSKVGLALVASLLGSIAGDAFFADVLAPRVARQEFTLVGLLDSGGLLASHLPQITEWLQGQYVGCGILALCLIAVWPSGKRTSTAGALVLAGLTGCWLVLASSFHHELRTLFELVTVVHETSEVSLHLVGVLILPVAFLVLTFLMSILGLTRSSGFFDLVVGIGLLVFWWTAVPAQLGLMLGVDAMWIRACVAFCLSAGAILGVQRLLEPLERRKRVALLVVILTACVFDLTWKA